MEPRLLLMTNRKLHRPTPFRLPPKSTVLDDLELEACTAAEVTGNPRGIRGDGYGAYGGSAVSGS